MNAGLITETCRIAWWKGYVKGRFVAVLESEARQPEVVAESPSWRWPGSAPPEPTDEARHALDALTDELVASGWTLDESQPEVWYERVLTRPATALAAVPDEPDEAPVLRVAPAEERRESQAVARLRSELMLALDEVERQQRLRSEAEERARRVATRPPAVAAPRLRLRATATASPLDRARAGERGRCGRGLPGRARLDLRSGRRRADDGRGRPRARQLVRGSLARRRPGERSGVRYASPGASRSATVTPVRREFG